MWYEPEKLIERIKTYFPVAWSTRYSHISINKLSVYYETVNFKIEITQGTFYDSVPGPYLEGTERGYLAIHTDYHIPSPSGGYDQGGFSTLCDTPEALDEAIKKAMERLGIAKDYSFVQLTLF